MIPYVLSSEHPDFISFSLAKSNAADFSKYGTSELDNFFWAIQEKSSNCPKKNPINDLHDNIVNV